MGVLVAEEWIEKVLDPENGAKESWLRKLWEDPW